MELYLHSLKCIHGVHRDYITLLRTACFLPASECSSWAATACSPLTWLRCSKAQLQVKIRSFSKRVGAAPAQIWQPLHGDGLNPFHIHEHRSFYRNINFTNGCAQVASYIVFAFSVQFTWDLKTTK